MYVSVDQIYIFTLRLTITLTTDGLAPIGDVRELALQLSSAVPATVELHERAHCVIVAANTVKRQEGVDYISIDTHTVKRCQ